MLSNRNRFFKYLEIGLVLLVIGLCFIAFIPRHRSNLYESCEPKGRWASKRLPWNRGINATSKIGRKVSSKDDARKKEVQSPKNISSYQDGTKIAKHGDGPTSKNICPRVPPNLEGILWIFRYTIPLEQLEKLHPELEPGGHFQPANCQARHRVAIIVPYRNRSEQLAPFFNHMHPFLQKQQIEYTIYIVEQTGNDPFNRGFLMNVGAIESLKKYKFDCFIFHDVDLLPEDDRNLYTCPDQPRHLSPLVDTLGYKLLSVDMFGGVIALTTEQFRTVNGFSNKFWGWGGEDDDMGNRVKFHGFVITRYPLFLGRYTMLYHEKAVPGPDRFKNLYSGCKRFATDGINSAKYKVLNMQFQPLCTWISVSLYDS